MPHYLNDIVVDEALNKLKNNVNKLTLCEGQPATYSEANTALGTGSGKKLGEVTVTSSNFTLADDPIDGRRLTCAALNNVGIDVAGDLTYLAWIDTVNSVLYKVLPLKTAINDLTTDSEVNVPSHYHAFRDAKAVV
jgi:hypothetical protein